MSHTVHLKQDYDIYFQSKSSLDNTEGLCESCELPLLEEKQRCNITWIFLQVFNQTWRWHFLTALSSMFLSIGGREKKAQSVLV